MPDFFESGDSAAGLFGLLDRSFHHEPPTSMRARLNQHGDLLPLSIGKMFLVGEIEYTGQLYQKGSVVVCTSLFDASDVVYHVAFVQERVEFLSRRIEDEHAMLVTVDDGVLPIPSSNVPDHGFERHEDFFFDACSVCDPGINTHRYLLCIFTLQQKNQPLSQLRIIFFVRTIQSSSGQRMVR